MQRSGLDGHRAAVGGSAVIPTVPAVSDVARGVARGTARGMARLSSATPTPAAASTPAPVLLSFGMLPGADSVELAQAELPVERLS